MDFPRLVTIMTYFAFLHEIKVSDSTKNGLAFRGDPRCGGVEERETSHRKGCGGFAILRLIL